MVCTVLLYNTENSRCLIVWFLRLFPKRRRFIITMCHCWARDEGNRSERRNERFYLCMPLSAHREAYRWIIAAVFHCQKALAGEIVLLSGLWLRWVMGRRDGYCCVRHGCRYTQFRRRALSTPASRGTGVLLRYRVFTTATVTPCNLVCPRRRGHSKQESAYVHVSYCKHATTMWCGERRKEGTAMEKPETFYFWV
jgi:hypothetical protein